MVGGKEKGMVEGMERGREGGRERGRECRLGCLQNKAKISLLSTNSTNVHVYTVDVCMHNALVQVLDAEPH